MRASIPAAALLALGACDEGGADGWTPVTLQSLEGTANYEYRTGSNGDGLSAEGDFDGDGETDRAVMVKDEAAGQYAVRVELASGERHVVGEGPLDRLPMMGLSPVPAGIYQTACGKGMGDCPPDAAPVIDLFHDGFTLATYESASRTFWWEDGEILSDWTGD